jgi:hypothetical protein
MDRIQVVDRKERAKKGQTNGEDSLLGALVKSDVCDRPDLDTKQACFTLCRVKSGQFMQVKDSNHELIRTFDFSFSDHVSFSKKDSKFKLMIFVNENDEKNGRRTSKRETVCLRMVRWREKRPDR